MYIPDITSGFITRVLVHADFLYSGNEFTCEIYSITLLLRGGNYSIPLFTDSRHTHGQEYGCRWSDGRGEAPGRYQRPFVHWSARTSRLLYTIEVFCNMITVIFCFGDTLIRWNGCPYSVYMSPYFLHHKLWVYGYVFVEYGVAGHDLKSFQLFQRLGLI